jgi:hypothetical protein
MFGCCCGAQVTDYKAVLLEYEPYRDSFFTPISYMLGTDSTACDIIWYYNSGFLSLPDSSVTPNLWRRYKKQTETWTSKNGYTKTTVSTATLGGGSSSNTTYSPDQSTFDTDWTSFLGGIGPQSYTEDVTAGVETHTVERTSSNTWNKTTVWEEELTDAEVWAYLEEFADGIDWSGVTNFAMAPLVLSGPNVWARPEEPGVWSYTGSWSLGSGVEWGPSVLTEVQDVLRCVLRKTNPDWHLAETVFAMGAKSLFRSSIAGNAPDSRMPVKKYRMMRVLMSNVGACVRKAEIDPSTGCATIYSQEVQTAEAIDAEPVTQPGEGFSISASGNYWRIASDWAEWMGDKGFGPDSQTVSVTVAVPRAGSFINSVAGCAGGFEDRYFTFGAAPEVAEDADNECEEEI